MSVVMPRTKAKSGIEYLKTDNIELTQSQKRINEENLKALHEQEGETIDTQYVDDDNKSVSDWSLTSSQMEAQEIKRVEEEALKKGGKRAKTLDELTEEELLIREKQRKRLRHVFKICFGFVCVCLLILSPIVYIYFIEPLSNTSPNHEGKKVFMNTEEARQISPIIILDCRDTVSTASIPGAIHTPWSFFTDNSQSGLLSPTATIQSKFREIGIEKTTTVLVYGEWNTGWGEEGRVYWNLQYMNITKSYILYGGFRAATAYGWVEASSPATCCVGTPSSVVVQPVEEIRIRKSEILGLIASPGNTPSTTQKLYLIDVRSTGEYDGVVQVNDESRLGRLPKSKHWHWKNVFMANTPKLKSCSDLKQEWSALGIPTGPEEIADANLYIVSYCLGGIRSSFVWSVMVWCGYENVKNYDGSWWEWSADSQTPIENNGQL